MKVDDYTNLGHKGKKKKDSHVQVFVPFTHLNSYRQSFIVDSGFEDIKDNRNDLDCYKTF